MTSIESKLGTQVSSSIGERGRQIIVASSSQLLAGDHDFTKFGIIPSVVLLCEIPEEISGSWYGGQVLIMMKDSVFEPSSPIRHSKELVTIIEQIAPEKPVLFIYSDGGPDQPLSEVGTDCFIFEDGSRLSMCYLYYSISIHTEIQWSR